MSMNAWALALMLEVSRLIYGDKSDAERQACTDWEDAHKED